jgi:hypothetical protein
MAMSGMLFAPHLHQYKEVLSRQGRLFPEYLILGLKRGPFF